MRAQRAVLFCLCISMKTCILSPLLWMKLNIKSEQEPIQTGASLPANKLCPLLSNPVISPDWRTLCRSTRCTGTSSTSYLQESGRRSREKSAKKERIWTWNPELRKPVLHIPPVQSRVSARKGLLLVPGPAPGSQQSSPLVSRPGSNCQDKQCP